MRPGPLTVRFRPGLRLTDEAFRRLCRANPELRLERTARGELVVLAPASPDPSNRNASLTARLWNWNEQTQLGIVFDSSAGFTLPNTAIRGPDASWLRAERWGALPREERETFARIVPDFVAELRSKSESKTTLRKKMREYVAQGVRLGWLIDPRTATVEVYRPGQPPEALNRPATLSGEDVLPGFELDLKGILYD